MITSPVVRLLYDQLFPAILRPFFGQDGSLALAILTFVVSLTLLFLALMYMSKFMKSALMVKIENLFDAYLFKTAIRSFALGTIITATIQSSSVTTSLVVQILAVLRREGLLQQAMKEVEEMLSRCELMFRSAVDMIMEYKDPEIDVFEEDKKIDRMEWEVRRKVLEHLVLGSKKGDVPIALILTSAVKDIERIGDYSKDILELAKTCPRRIIVEKDITEFFKGIEGQILEIFTLTRDAYKEADTQKAQTAMDIQWQIAKRCDEVFESLTSEPILFAERAIIYALLSRYLKRVSSHLKNIASSVVDPFRSMETRAIEEEK